VKTSNPMEQISLRLFPLLITFHHCSLVICRRPLMYAEACSAHTRNDWNRSGVVKNGGAVPPFRTSSCRSAYLIKHKDNFTIALCLKGKSETANTSPK
jgi:hypothetical protein